MHTLTSPASYTDNAVSTFTAPAGATLDTSTDYLVVFEGAGDSISYFVLGLTSSNGQDRGTRVGWGIENARRVNGTLTSDGNSYQVSVNGSAIGTPVLSSWSLIPSGLSVGDEFRLLFLSSTGRDAEASGINAYNTFIQDLANAGHTDIQEYSDGFKVVGCTRSAEAPANTRTIYTTSDKGVPIYWLNGNKLADDYEDFYDGSWDEEANDKNESGTDGPDTSQSANRPWTGCDHDGTSEDHYLGDSTVTFGRPNTSGSANGPLSSANSGFPTETHPMYGLSEIFQVVMASSDATLSALTVNDGTNDLTLDPTFASATYVYETDVANSITTATLTATPNHSEAEVTAVTLDGTAIADTDFTDGITVPSLVVNDNEIVVTVTAEDATTQTYTVTVTRAPTATPTVSISANKTTAVFKLEGITYTLTRTGSTTAALPVSVTLTQTKDFLATSELTKTVTIAAGQSTKTFNVAGSSFQHFAAGTAVEAGTLTATVQDGTDYELGTTTTVDVAIVIGAMVQIELASSTITEGAGTLGFTIIGRTGPGAPRPSATTSSLYLGAVDGTAEDGIDFNFSDGATSFTSSAFISNGGIWQAEESFSITITNDTLDEDDESFKLQIYYHLGHQNTPLVDASGNSCGTTCEVTATIIDDDTATPPVTPPGQVFGVNITASDQTLQVNWTRVTGATGYKVQWKSGGQNYGSSRQATVSSGSTTSRTISSLNNGTEYTVRVIATKTGVSDGTPSADVNGTPTASTTSPTAPRGLNATAVGNTRINLSWNAPDSDGGSPITGYKIEVSSNGNSWTTRVANTGSANRTYSHTGLSTGDTRHYRVSAINSSGTGPHSNVARPPSRIEATSLPNASTLLSSDAMVRAISEAGYQPLCLSRPDIGDAILPYVESGIPVILGLDIDGSVGHAVTVIGRVFAKQMNPTNRAIDYVLAFVVHDDQSGPYRWLPADGHASTTYSFGGDTIKHDSGNGIIELNISDHAVLGIALMSTRVYSTGARAEHNARSQIDDVMKGLPGARLALAKRNIPVNERLLDELQAAHSADEIVLRTYLTSYPSALDGTPCGSKGDRVCRARS